MILKYWEDMGKLYAKITPFYMTLKHPLFWYCEGTGVLEPIFHGYQGTNVLIVTFFELVILWAAF